MDVNEPLHQKPHMEYYLDDTSVKLVLLECYGLKDIYQVHDTTQHMQLFDKVNW